MCGSIQNEAKPRQALLAILMTATFWSASFSATMMQQASGQTPPTSRDTPQSQKSESQPKLFSGPQRGEKIRRFSVLKFKGDEVEEIEVAPLEKGISLICFVHKLSNDDRILYGLGLVDFYTRQHKELKSHIVVLAKDREKTAKLLGAWTKGTLFTKSQVSLSTDGEEGPGYYGLNRNAAMTVIIADGNKVIENLVFNAPNAYDLETIMQSVARSVGASKPTLAEVQQALRNERQRQQLERMKSSPLFEMAPNQELGTLMFNMIYARGNRAKNAQLGTKRMSEWAGDDPDRWKLIKSYCSKVLEEDFKLNMVTRAAIKKLSEQNLGPASRLTKP